MSLTTRVTKLEAGSRERASQPCRWHGPLVIYPPTLPRDEGGRVILPPCEAPATCPSATGGQIFLPARRTA
jgi:hypothetical protein